jgi:hypothetical protein
VKFTMEISCDNDAFVSDDGSMWLRNLEVAEILVGVAASLENDAGIGGYALKDSNGNKVGSFGFDEES